jgi:amino acid transporter
MLEPVAHDARLRPTLGFADVVGFLIVAVASPRWIATAAAAGPSVFAVWLIALVAFFLPLGFATLELSSRYPREGGLYVWCREAFGDFAGFVAGWMYWASNLTFFPGVLYFAAGNLLFAFGPRAQALSNEPVYYLAFSLIALGVVLALNVLGAGLGRRLANLGAWGTWLPVGVLVVAAGVAWLRFGPATPFHAADLVPRIDSSGVAFWATIAFAFGGLEAAALFGDEIVDARRTLPRALVAAGVVIVAIYLIGTAAMLVALPAKEVSEVQGITQAIARACTRVGAPGVVPVAALLLVVSGVASVSAWLAASARLPFVGGMERVLPAAFGRVHARWGTPFVALIVQGVGSAAFIVMSQAGTGVRGAYDALVGITVIAYFIPFLLMFAALIKLQRAPAGADVIRAPGGRPVAIAAAVIGSITTAVAMVIALLPPPGEKHPALAVAKVAGGSLALLLVGAVLYARRERSPARAR